MKGRQRGRNGGKPRPHHQGGGGGGHRNPNYEQNFGRMRGNAQQLLDKYLAMAREAHQQGDRVAAENFFQHADHYFRVLNERFQGQQQNNNQRRPNGQSYDRPYGEGGQNDGQQDGQNDGQDQYGGNQYGGNQGGGYQGNYNNQGQSDTSQQGTPHQSMMAADQPHMTANQPPPQQHQQHQNQNQNQHHQPRQQTQHHQNQPQQNQQQQPVQQVHNQHHQPHPRSDSDGDIGLPSSLFGAQPSPPQTQFVQDEAPAGETGGEIAGEARAFRPRQGRRRRFRSDSPAAGQDPSDSSQS